MKKRFKIAILILFILAFYWVFKYLFHTRNPTYSPQDGNIIKTLLQSSKSEKLYKWETSGVPMLFLISFDGFRWDYLKIYKNLTNLNKLLKSGSYVDFVQSSHPTLTFPNHWTMVTGLHPESHGIIHNYMNDKSISETFSHMNSSTHTDKWFFQNKATEPIWLSNLKGDENRRSAAEWVGSMATKHDRHKFIPFDRYRAHKSYIDEYIDLFIRKDEPINFGALYIMEPDYTGHVWGPYSVQMKEKLEEIDSVVGYLMNKIEKNNLSDKLNLIVTSDHGMEEISPENAIFLYDYIDTTLFETLGTIIVYNIYVDSPTKSVQQKLGIQTKSDLISYIYEKLSVINHMEIYRKKDIPEVFHLKNNVRNGDILIIADVGHSFVLHEPDDWQEYWKMKRGQHGFVTKQSSMNPIFMGSGPAFKTNHKIRNFRNVDIYPLMCYILGVKPGANNGSLEHTIDMIDNHKETGDL